MARTSVSGVSSAVIITTEGGAASAARLLEHVEAAHAGQVHVEQHHVGRCAAQRCRSASGPSAACSTLVARGLEQRRERMAQRPVVVDDQDARLGVRCWRSWEPHNRALHAETRPARHCRVRTPLRSRARLPVCTPGQRGGIRHVRYASCIVRCCKVTSCLGVFG